MLGKFKIFLINLVLFIVATILLIIFAGIGLNVAIFDILFKRYTTNYFKDVATEIDILGNVMCGPLFNYVLRKKNSIHKFGQMRMTISECLGLLQRDGGLTLVGELVASTLDLIDYDHCKKAIRDEIKC